MDISSNIINPVLNDSIPQARIVDGLEVKPPFKYSNTMVEIKRTIIHTCGGVLFNENTVITAAHCSLTPQKFDSVLVHRHNLEKSTEEEGGKEYKVIKKTVHPMFNKKTFQNDVAIWKLDGNVEFKPKLRLDDGKYGNVTDTPLNVIGWGAIQHKGYASSVLMETTLPVYNNTLCRTSYQKKKDDINPEYKLCAGFETGGTDSCQGDSGGPLFKMEGDTMVLVGITSYGIGCARPELPGTYTRVSRFRHWIMANIK
ncbi:putative trypsin-like serine protease precursor [Conidiobolus coronatus NRRL 28638]|uniref:Putative trypsin-like serine protease n=1 Tax=Conidiobolus coronatus (strain ATCC 28846 / CBS 209.66 / NRRL 28638) TaxID=796925 RepID=A0A137PCP4_CONC2|nr:putative trypsin-like serine protease precursor [Conidiobolus coronatus NRRL 28638]|eukprot:KXN72760.1 putative trypsin-like serine protease precursor [Conidiobolus coronatus NRRL 28638]